MSERTDDAVASIDALDLIKASMARDLARIGEIFAIYDDDLQTLASALVSVTGTLLEDLGQKMDPELINDWMEMVRRGLVDRIS